MGKIKKYKSIVAAIKDNISQEVPRTKQLIFEVRHAKKRGYLSKREFMSICRWKSPRSIRHFEKNTEKDIKKITKEAFLTDHEKTKIARLTRLRGVGIPVASALLAITQPKKYGIIDIRVWQCFYHYGVVKDNPKGVSFTPERWYEYLIKLRFYAKKVGEKTRTVEMAIFNHHKKSLQKGNLYK